MTNRWNLADEGLRHVLGDAFVIVWHQSAPLADQSDRIRTFITSTDCSKVTARLRPRGDARARTWACPHFDLPVAGTH